MTVEYEKTILSSRLEVQEQTFQNISREIHDNIGISLTLAKLNLNTLNLNDGIKTLEQINSSICLLSKAINDLSDISHGLNAEYIAGYGLINALKQEIEKLRKLGIHEVSFGVSGESVFMDAQKELIIFRISQEALNNILKHAHAQTIDIRLSYDSAGLSLSIIDNGIGFQTCRNSKTSLKVKGSGLINMEKRAEMINGEWMLKSGKGGTSIQLSVPY